MDGTILGQGTFTANLTNLTNPNSGSSSVGQANATIIQIPSGADWVSVRNYTQYGTVGTSGAYFNGTANAYPGIEFYWQLGMAAGTGIVNYYTNSSNAVNGDTLTAGGFTLYDPSGQNPNAQPLTGSPVAITAATNVVRPVVTTTTTAGLAVGSVVRLSNNSGNADTIYGIDVVVGAVTNGTTFTLLTATNALATANGQAGTAGFYRVVNTNPLFYPRRRYITKITQAVNGQVSTSVEHSLTVGQEVTFNIPTACGMTQLNPSPANNYMRSIVASIVDPYNFTINTNTTSFTAFTSPTYTQLPVTWPQVVPMGEDTSTALQTNNATFPQYQGQNIYQANNGILADSTINTGFLGMILGSGGNGTVLTTPILGPAGSVAWTSGNAGTGDTLYWVAGKSTYGGQ